MRAGFRAALVGVHGEIAEQRGQVGVGHAAHGNLAVLNAVADDVAHGSDLDAVLFSEDFEIGQAGHGAVFLHDFADDGSGLEAGELREIDAAFSLAGALENAAGTGAQGEDVAGHDEVFGAAVVSDRGEDRRGSVSGGNAGRHAFAGFDGNREVRAELRVVVAGHHGQLQLVADVGGQGEADEAAAVVGHEVDDLRGHEFGGDGQIAFVFPVLVVHEDDHPAFLDFGNRFNR